MNIKYLEFTFFSFCLLSLTYSSEPFAQIDCGTAQVRQMLRHHGVKPVFLDNPNIQARLLGQPVGIQNSTEKPSQQAIEFCENFKGTGIGPNGLLELKKQTVRLLVEHINSLNERGCNLIPRVLEYFRQSFSPGDLTLIKEDTNPFLQELEKLNVEGPFLNGRNETKDRLTYTKVVEWLKREPNYAKLTRTTDNNGSLGWHALGDSRGPFQFPNLKVGHAKDDHSPGVDKLNKRNLFKTLDAIATTLTPEELTKLGVGALVKRLSSLGLSPRPEEIAFIKTFVEKNH
jgi:hypothetical protein